MRRSTFLRGALAAAAAPLGFLLSNAAAGKRPVRYYRSTGISTAISVGSTTASIWPASFFTGPLGARNVVPSRSPGALFGAWTGDSNASGGTPSGQRTVITTRITALGRTPDMLATQENTLTTGGVSSIDWIHSIGSIPVVIGDGPNCQSYGFTPAQIVAGSADATIDAVAARLAKSYRVMFDPFREFANTLTNIDTSGKQSDFRGAWQRIVTRFQAAGATNVGFFFCPGEQGSVTNRGYIDACYPGDTYVDWIGSTAYNSARVGVFDAVYHDGWATHDETIDYAPNGTTITTSMANTWGGIKPYIQGECSCRYDSGTVNRKRDWLTAIDTVTKANLGNKLLGIVFFDELFREGGATGQAWQDWRLDSDLTSAQRDSNVAADGGSPGSADSNTLSGWHTLANSANWTVGAIGGAT